MSLLDDILGLVLGLITKRELDVSIPLESVKEEPAQVPSKPKEKIFSLSLIRNKFCVDGIFGELINEFGQVMAYTLEHAFLQEDGTYKPKLNNGTHLCVLGTHQLDHGGPFKAYEITGVPGHKGILFHIGNMNKDQDGCTLLGKEVTATSVTGSKEAFDAFMALTDGIASFPLTVS